MGKLRDQFQRDLEIKSYSPQTRQAYLARVCEFVQHFNRSPVDVGVEYSARLQFKSDIAVSATPKLAISWVAVRHAGLARTECW